MLNPSRSRLRLPAVALAALTAATVGLSACGGDDNPQLQEKTIELKDRDTDAFSYLDNAPKTSVGEDGPEEVSNGDQLTFSNDLLDAAGKDVGDTDVTCIFTRATGPMDSASAVCGGVMTVPGGSLTLSVGGKPFASEGANVSGSIVGGTGDYAGATGDFVSEGEPSVTSAHVFVPES
jgi:hypothetical protein